MNEVVITILMWIAVNVPGYEDAATMLPPEVMLVSREVLCEKASLEASIKQELIAKCLTKIPEGGYHEGDRTIYFPLDFDIDNPKTQDRVVHEVFHEVQRHYGHYDKWRAGDKNYCSGRIEFEAYRVQMKWRFQNGITPVRIIDPAEERRLKNCAYTF